MKRASVLLFLCSAFAASAGLTDLDNPGPAVTSVAARQRYPWNGLVDVDVAFTGQTGTTYRIELTATDKAGGTNLPVRTAWLEGAPSAVGNPVDVPAPGTHRLVWNAGSDLPAGFVANRVTVTAKPSLDAATTLESGEFAVDLRESPRVSAGTETLTYSTRWAGADALAGCTRKARFEVAGYAGAETLADVPVLVRLSSAISGFDYADFADGVADLVFCDEAETTVYPHEIDEWNTNGESLVWVRLPVLEAGAAFKAGWGGPAATAAQTVATAHAVWSDYAGVWHMNEDSGTAFDSTANGLDAQPEMGTNVLSDISQMVACEQGAVGRARVNATQPVASGNHLSVPTYDHLCLGRSFVVSGWFHADIEEQFWPKLFWRDWDSAGWGVEFRTTVSRVDVVGGETGSWTKYIGNIPLNRSAASDWTWFCVAYNGTSASLYQDGVLVTNGVIVAATDNGKPFGIGGNGGETGSHSFVGQYDEIRLRGGSLSADRIRADYDMVANSGFVTVGAVETAVPVSVEIRLDGEVFAGNLSGEGTVDWTPTAPGIYEFHHISRLDGETIAVETVSFAVPGTEAEDLSILAEGDLTEGATIRLGGAADGWTLHYTTDGSEPTATSPVYTSPFELAQSATVKVVAVSDAHGWTSGVAEQRFDLAPPLAVTGATARQRYPWNGLVDLDFTLAGDAARRYRVLFDAIDLDGRTNLLAKTVWEDRGSITNAALDLVPGAHRLVWNAAADLPEGFVAERMSLDIRVEPIHDTALYLVVDLSGGPNAERYPVSYLPDVPEGGWTDEYKTDKLVLRRIEPGSEETCGEPMFAAVFETTQGQFENITGTNTTDVAVAGKRRPVGISYADYVDFAIASTVSYKSQLPGVCIPGTNQWIRVCRANTVSDLNSGKVLTDRFLCPNAAEVGRYAGNSGWKWDSDLHDVVQYQSWDGLGGYDKTAEVGSYMPNAWGVFDMHGNCWEWCSESENETLIAKGGSWNSHAISSKPEETGQWDKTSPIKLGFRLFLHDAPTVVEAPIVAPAGLTASTNRTGDVTLAWEPVAGAYAYQIRRSKTGDFEDGTWLNTVTNTTYADWTAEPRADYAYWVRAQFESGRVGRWSEAAAGCRYKGYTVRFNANGGTGTMSDIECFFDQPRALPANVFEKTDVVFAGWATNATGTCIYADGETIENLATEAGATVVLYACWASSSYTVKFNKNASAATGTMADQTMTRNANAALRANAFVRAGYRFAGWATSSSGAKVYNDKQSVKNITTDSSITLYAVWEQLTAQNALYMVVDISGGANASSYTVSYLSAVPSGGWTTTYKTTKMVLRRINPGTFSMCGQYTTTLTEPYYIGVFEMTEKQYKLITGSNAPMVSTHVPHDDRFPVRDVSYNMIRGSSNGSKWPASSSVDSSSIVGKIRSRTGIALDLPTEAQWEYACRAGTTTSFNNGGSSRADAEKVGCYSENAPYWDKDGYWGTRPNYVGSYKANAWGLYDMHGNLAEWCLDWFGNNLSSPQTDPKGPSSGSSRVVRDGTYLWSYTQATSSSRTSIGSPDFTTSIYGFRLCVTVK